MQYGREAMGFEEDLLRPFWLIITELDTAFLAWMKSEHDRYLREHKPTKKPGARSTSKRTYTRAK